MNKKKVWRCKSLVELISYLRVSSTKRMCFRHDNNLSFPESLRLRHCFCRHLHGCHHRHHFHHHHHCYLCCYHHYHYLLYTTVVLEISKSAAGLIITQAAGFFSVNQSLFAAMVLSLNICLLEENSNNSNKSSANGILISFM